MPSNTSTGLYNHKITFVATSGQVPAPVSGIFEISAGTKFIPWKFKGEQLADNIKITLSGSAYSMPIVIENYVCGKNSVMDHKPNTIPKSAQTLEYQYFQKVTSLTALTINNGDKLLIDVTPSTSETNWELYFGCLDSFDVSPMLTTPYKLISKALRTTAVELTGNSFVIGVSNSTDPNKTKLTTNIPHELTSITAYTQFPIRIAINNIAAGYNYYNGNYIIERSDVLDATNFQIEKTPNPSYIGVLNSGLLRFSGKSCSNTINPLALSGITYNNFLQDDYRFFDEQIQYNNETINGTKTYYSAYNKWNEIISTGTAQNYQWNYSPSNQYSNLFFNTKNCQQFSTCPPSGCGNNGCKAGTSILKYGVTKSGNLNIYGLTSNTASDISSIYDDWQIYRNAFYSPGTQIVGFTGSTDPNNIGYYRYILLNIPRYDSTDACPSDNFDITYMYLHLASVVQSGFTNGNYWLNITPHTINLTQQNLDSISSFCDVGCWNNIKSITSIVNGNATGNTSNSWNWTSTKGVNTIKPINYVVYISSAVTANLSATTYGYVKTTTWQHTTYPYSGTNTLIPSLSGTTPVLLSQDNADYSTTLGFKTNNYWRYNYMFVLTNPDNVLDFDVYASPIANGVYSGWPGQAIYKKVYTYVNSVGTILDSNYVI